jgi:hypothetical protein
VASIMERKFMITAHLTTIEDLTAILAEDPVWLLVRTSEQPSFIINTAELKVFLEESATELSEIDLSTLSVNRKKVTGITLQATLTEALSELNSQRADALFVYQNLKKEKQIAGILLRASIDDVYPL